MKTNRERIEFWFEQVWGKRNDKLIEELVHPDCEVVGLPGAPRGAAGFRLFYELLAAAFTRTEVRVVDSVESGYKIYFRCDCHFTGKDGKRHQFTGGGMARLKDERYIEAWNVWDFLTLMTSMGDLAPSAFLDSVRALAEDVR